MTLGRRQLLHRRLPRIETEEPIALLLAQPMIPYRIAKLQFDQQPIFSTFRHRPPPLDAARKALSLQPTALANHDLIQLAEAKLRGEAAR